MKRITLATISKIVGVSKPVVCTVLKNNEGKGIFVGKHTRERILETARELGYVPPKSAKELFSGRSNNIGIIVHKLVPPFSEFVNHLQKEADQLNFEITPYLTDGNAELEEHYLNLVRDGRIDGVIALAVTEGSIQRYRKFIKHPYNLKILFYGEPIPEVPSIHFDERKVGKLAAQHLIETGCKRLAVFGGYNGSVRIKGFTQYLKERRFPAPLVFTKEPFVNYFPEGKTLAEEFLRLKYLPDGVFACNDLLAIALLTTILKKGVEIPKDMAILGCDNTELCLYTIPTLTSIDTNLPALAKKAMQKMIKIIEGTEVKPFHTKTPVSLVVRESTRRE
ncbi:MAG: LacI family DNA-binding transcriptional regulator [Candidatus Omnitrophota bacterium]